MKELVGHEINKIFLSKDGQMVRFELGNGSDLFYYADGDCCSSTWFESIEIPALTGKWGSFLVKSVDSIGLPGEKEDEDGLLQVYGIAISVEIGKIIIDYRNSSNGYYGGRCDLASLRLIKKYINEDWDEWVSLEKEEVTESLNGRYEQF